MAPVEWLLSGPRNDIRGAIRQTEKYSAIFRLAIAGAGPSLAPASLTSAQEAGEAGFNFIVFGDMPYRMPGDLKGMKTLIAIVSTEEPAFSVHVRDVKSGLANCSTDYYLTIRSYFDRFDGAERMFWPPDCRHHRHRGSLRPPGLVD